MKNRKHLITAAIILLGLGLFLLANFKIANTQTTDSANKTTPTPNESDRNFPVVSLDASGENRAIDAKRRELNSKYDSWSWVKPTVIEEETGSVIVNDWQIGLPALPVRMSDAVIVGTVKTAEAFLSNDKGAVYSEFTIQVTSFVKDNPLSPVKTGEIITVQRAGGRVKYESGKILKHSISGQEMPSVNGKYVFFLTYDQQRQVYRIMTGYEIVNRKITPLDGKGKPKGSGYDGFRAFEGFDEEKFMNEVKTALLTQTNPQKEKTSP